MKKVLSALLLVPIVAMMAVPMLAGNQIEWTPNKKVVNYGTPYGGIWLNFTSSFPVTGVSENDIVTVTIWVNNLATSNGSVTLTHVDVRKTTPNGPNGAEAYVSSDGSSGLTISPGDDASFEVSVTITKLKGGKANVHLWVHLTEDLQGFIRPHHVGVNLICRP